MVNIEKRFCFWRLHSFADRIFEIVETRGYGTPSIHIDEFLEILDYFGFDNQSPALSDVLKVAQSDDSSHIDVQILFHVIGEAVNKIRDRNISFWITVMTITGASISWVDFRRKLSKWLSTNGMGIAQIKNVISFVQQNVDPLCSGSVKKDTFLRFVDDLMGYDCLLCPGSFSQLQDERPKGSAWSPQPSSITRNSAVKYNPDTKKSGVIMTVSPLETARPSPPAAFPSISVEKSSQSRSSTGLSVIRLRLAVGCMQKLTSNRLRVFFALFRIASISQISNVGAPQGIEGKRRVQRDSNREGTISMFLSMQLVRRRLLLQALRLMSAVSSRRLTSDVSTCQTQEPTMVQIGADALLDDSPGPSWTVTIQAVAVANLIGILRTCLTRAIMPAYFSLKSGHSVDIYNPLRKILFAQSKQGQKDSLMAVPKTGRVALQPISENAVETNLFKENIPEKALEFDLSI
jgi:hypothetical protein